jgi:HTH-type transcriptional regulator/antitoxin MqsA
MKTELQRRCSNCEEGQLHADVRNVRITHKGLNTTVKNIAGLFCDKCDEIEFDASTDSAQRYAEAGDKIVLRHRANAAATLKLQRRRLKLTQAQASALTGGGHNAFSRYETGAAQAVPAVYNLFALLDKHPELLKDLMPG